MGWRLPNVRSSLVPIRNVVLDTQKAEVARNGEQVKLTAREFHLLRYSAEHFGIALISQELFRQVWGHRAERLHVSLICISSYLLQKL